MSTDQNRSALTKYLSRYAEAEVTLVPRIVEQYDHLLMIPVFDESFEAISSLLNTTFNGQRVLFILVINCPENADPNTAERTVRLWRALLESEFMQPTAHHSAPCADTSIAYSTLINQHGLLMVNRCAESQRIPKKQGVGLARKIAADIACDLINKGIVSSKWIHSTDADVTLPSDYFELPEDIKGQSVALLYPFEHSPASGFEVAGELYDWSLRYFVESLRWAGSHYAYYTIGSLIAVHYEAYAKVRGFPKRSGGEDFYLLNKLAKVGRITCMNAPVVNVAARPSHRVPFGTGPAITKIVDQGDAMNTFVLYHPSIFIELKACLEIMVWSWNIRETPLMSSTESIFSEVQARRGVEKYGEPSVAPASAEAIGVLSSLGFSKAWRHAIDHSKDQAQFIRQLTTWFDAFVTLKFIHALRADYYPSLPLKYLTQHADYLSENLCERAEKLLIIEG